MMMMNENWNKLTRNKFRTKIISVDSFLESANILDLFLTFDISHKSAAYLHILQ